MDPKKLVTLTFPKNVGTNDRVFRLVSGLALVVSGMLFSLPMWAGAAIGVSGVLWMVTGVLSRCSIYYMLGHSTCPVADQK